MKKFLLLLNLVQFVIILIISNPSELAHRAYVAQQLKTRLKEGNDWLEKLRSAAETTQGFMADYHNYYICSTLSKDGKTLTIGALGMVRWVADKDQPYATTR
ncbi:MAG: hypothetical protein N2595_10410 [bacterium]|nr:hypothetical protein [bacterium]